MHTYATDGTYNVCLITTDACGNDTSCHSLTISTNTVAAAVPESFGISIASDPAGQAVRVNTMGPASKNLKLRLLNMQGKVLWQLEQPGRQVQVPVTGLPAGIYALQLRDANASVVRKIVLY